MKGILIEEHDAWIARIAVIRYAEDIRKELERFESAPDNYSKWLCEAFERDRELLEKTEKLIDSIENQLDKIC